MKNIPFNMVAEDLISEKTSTKEKVLALYVIILLAEKGDSLALDLLKEVVKNSDKHPFILRDEFVSLKFLIEELLEKNKKNNLY